MRRRLGVVPLSLAALLLLTAAVNQAWAVSSRVGPAPITAVDGAVSVTTIDAANDIIVVEGTFTATLQFEGTIGTTWFSVQGTPVGGGAAVTSTTATGQWTVGVPLSGLRVRASAYTSGTANVTIYVTSAGGGGGGAAVNQGTSPWLVAPDGTSWAKTGTSANVASIASDTTTTTTALGAAAATITVALAGQVGAVFQLQSGGTGVYTVTPQCSFDGGTTYPLSVPLTDPSTGLDAPTVTISSGQGTTPYTVVCPFGASNARMNVTAYTSGTANWIARATVGGFPNSVVTPYNTAATVSAANTAAVITLTGVTGQRWCVYGLDIQASAASTTNVTVTIQDGATVVRNLGAFVLAAGGVATFLDSINQCASTGNNLVINIGAAGVGLTTTTTVSADRG